MSEPRATTAREVALQVCRDVFGQTPRRAREALDYRLRHSELTPRDRAFATELAYGAIKMRRSLDYELQPYLGERAKALPQPIAEILRLGTYQLRHMDGVEAYAAVSESVGLARKYGHKGTAGLVNAVLRRVASDPPRPGADEATRASLPTWIVSHWRERFGANLIDAILAGVNEPAAGGLSVDLRKTTRDDALAALAEAKVAARPSAFAADAIVLEGTAPTAQIEALARLRWHRHAEAASFPVDLLDPQPGRRVVELCSGRGNKTLQIASRMGDRGTILSVDDDAKKIALNAARLAEAGIGSVALVTADATAMPATGDADAVLLDAPCSALGILGRQPEARWRKSPDDPARMQAVQRAMIASAARCVKPGGVLVYSVCSTDRREAEDVVEPFLAAHAEFARVAPPQRYAPFATAAGDLLVPPGIDRRDGFYIARMRRSA